MRNADHPLFAQELVSYQYSTLTETKGHLEKVEYFGEGFGEMYRYGSFEPENGSGDHHIVYKSEDPLNRTLAMISAWSNETGEVPQSAYSYRAGGIDYEGFSRLEPYRTYGIVHDQDNQDKGSREGPGMIDQSMLKVKHTLSRPGWPNNGDEGAVGGEYAARVYKGDFDGPFTDYYGAWNRNLMAQMNSEGYEDRNFHLFYSKGLQQGQDPTFTGNVTRIYRGQDNLPEVDEHGDPVDAPGTYYAMTVYRHEVDPDPPFLSRFNMLSYRDRQGRWRARIYDDTWNRPTAVSDFYGRINHYEYDPNHGQVTRAYNNFNDRETTFTYNSYNQLATITSATGGTTTFSYYANGSGPLEEVVNTITGRIVTLHYDEMGRVRKVESNDGPDVEMEYDGIWLERQIVDNITVSRFERDAFGRVNKVFDAHDAEAGILYDERGRRVGVTNAEGGQQTFIYDEYDQLELYIDGEGAAVAYEYDGLGRVIKEILDPGQAHLVTQFWYDGEGSCGSCSGGAGHGQLSRIVDPKGQVKVFEYDDFGRMVAYREYPENTDPLPSPSRVVEYSRDFVVDLGAGPAPFVPADVVTGITDTGLPSTGTSYAFAYDNQLRLLKSFHPEGYYEEYFYDNFDRQEARRDVDGGIYEFDFDADGLLEGITDPNGLAIAYLYNIGTTLPDPTAPRGALLEVEHANGTLVEYGYDSLNRLDSLVNRSSLGSVMSSFGYTYDDVGNITRIDLAGGDAWVYQYDDVYQLTREERRNPSDAVRWHRVYEYDLAGNRKKMTWEGGKEPETITYTYNSLNQLTQSWGPVSGGLNYAYDENGNRETAVFESGINKWSVDDRLTMVSTEGGTVEYAYDHLGQRILRRAHDGIRTRYFFAGLTEEIVKTSVPGAHTDNAFAVEVAIEAGDDTAWNQGVGSGATIGSVYDEERRKDVTHFLQPAMDCHQRFDAPITSTTKRVISLWHRRDWDCGQIVVHASTSAGQVRINYRRDAGTDWVDTSGATWAYYVHLDLPTGEWNRVEQDIAADIQRLTPAVQYQSAHGVWLWGRDFRVDDIRFSNAMTTERNSLLPGSIGQIAYRERWEGTGGSPTPTYGGSARGGGERRWNSYNHIGNVVGTSDANGYFVEAVDTDAFGNPLASTQTGEWAGGLGGNRGLTTKELDPAAGLYYFYQRWYDPQTATFASRAPYPPMMEHPYGYAVGNPVLYMDPTGKFFKSVIPGPPGEWLDKGIGEVVSVCRDWSTTAARKGGNAVSETASASATVAGPVWGSPNTILGFGLGFGGSVLGSWAYQLGLTSEGPLVDFGDGAMRFNNNPLLLSQTALSLGHTHHYGRNLGPESPHWTHSWTVHTGAHEAGHTRQSNLLGPFYLPVYAVSVIDAKLRGRHWHDNFMERWADDIALCQDR